MSFAHHAEDHHASVKTATPLVTSSSQNIQIDHTKHAVSNSSKTFETVPQDYDHRKEHGAQVYAVTTVDNQWLVKKNGAGDLKSEFETRIGTDENKVFIKIHADKEESHETNYNAKFLYSRMISDFWDAQFGARYRSEKTELDHYHKDTEEYVDAVVSLHGMAPYFFETNMYLYAGKDRYAGFSLETERDLLITQKLIIQPYLELDVIFSDDSKYPKKTGLSNAIAGIETRYEISKKVMPYINIAYEYSQDNNAIASISDKNWLYGVGTRFKF